MSNVVYPGRDPMGPLAFINSATRIPFMLKFVEGGWQRTRYQLMQVFDTRLDEHYELMLGDESKLTDMEAEYVIYVVPEEAEKATVIIEYMTKN